MPVQSKAQNNQDAHKTKHHADHYAQLPRGALRPCRRRQSPLAQKIPNAYAKVKRRRHNSYDHECQRPRVRQLLRNFRVRSADDPERPPGIYGDWVSLESDIVLAPGSPGSEIVDPGRTD